MRAGQQDQAAGLRRLLRRSPPEVMAVLPFGGSAVAWLARQILQRQAAGLSVLAVDEWGASGNLADCLGVACRFDLLQAIEGHVDLPACRVEVTPGLNLVAAARLARDVAANRLTRQRALKVFTSLQAGCDEWLIHARPAGPDGLSPLTLAAPRLLLVVEPSAQSITGAYAVLKALKQGGAGADIHSAAIALAGQETAESRALLANLRSVAQRLLGISLVSASSIGDALVRLPARSGASDYVERLRWPLDGAAAQRTLS